MHLHVTLSSTFSLMALPFGVMCHSFSWSLYLSCRSQAWLGKCRGSELACSPDHHGSWEGCFCNTDKNSCGAMVLGDLTSGQQQKG